MGLLSKLFGKVESYSVSYNDLVPQLITDLKALREQYLFETVTTLNSLSDHINYIDRILKDGSKVDSLLKGYHLTMIIGFSMNYLKSHSIIPFEIALVNEMDCDDKNIANEYREKFLNCQGEVECLSFSFAEYLHSLWYYPVPKDKFINALANGAVVLGIMSQALTAKAFGDEKTEKKLKKKLKP